mmetsp:Transcript_28364/g.90245  ORF Transcript_28364/g.90245 Transcript_28364/m.90245 type:complete len:254 (+) Transcript_28364:1636-2397(+)
MKVACACLLRSRCVRFHFMRFSITTSGSCSKAWACQRRGAKRCDLGTARRWFSRKASVIRCSCAYCRLIRALWIAPSRRCSSMSKKLTSSMTTKPAQLPSKRLNSSVRSLSGAKKPCWMHWVLKVSRVSFPSLSGGSKIMNISDGPLNVSATHFRKRLTRAPSTGASSSKVKDCGESSPKSRTESTDSLRLFAALQKSKKFTSKEPSGSSSRRQPRSTLPPPRATSAAITAWRSASAIPGCRRRAPAVHVPVS